jgi:hypothetical protein
MPVDARRARARWRRSVDRVSQEPEPPLDSRGWHRSTGGPDASSPETWRRTPGGARLSMPRGSPDGAKLAFVEDSELVVFDVPDGSISVLSEQVWNPRPRWSPDGQHLIVPSPEPALHAIDLTTGSVTLVLADAAGHDVTPEGALYFVRGQRDELGKLQASLHRLPSFRRG